MLWNRLEVILEVVPYLNGAVGAVNPPFRYTIALVILAVVELIDENALAASARRLELTNIYCTYSH